MPAERLACLDVSAPPAPAGRHHRPQALQDPAVRRTIADHVLQVQELLRQRGHDLPLEGYGRHPGYGRTSAATGDRDRVSGQTCRVEQTRRTDVRWSGAREVAGTAAVGTSDV